MVLLLREHLIELVGLSAVEASRLVHVLLTAIFVARRVCNFDVLLVSHHYFGCLVPLLLLVSEHWPDSDADLDASILFGFPSFGTEFGDAHAERLGAGAERTDGASHALAH